MSSLEQLEQRISKLEEQVNKSSLSMFGRSYSQTGSLNSDYLIKTKGQVKIQFGSKFIDLIKDGKINVNSKFIFTVDTSNNIGNKDGLYVTNDGSVYLKSGNTVINLVGEVSTVYVSFMEKQETTSDQKYLALKNIGLIYDTLEQVDNTALQNGIIYVQNEHKLYLVQNGELTEFKIEFPNPFTEQFIIQKSNNKQGALLIKGNGINNSLAFDSMYLYVDQDGAYINSNGDINFSIRDNVIIGVRPEATTINNPVQSNMFQSTGATENTGFRLYWLNGESTLEVDNIIERNRKSTLNIDVYPEFLSSSNNIIVSSTQDTQSDNTLALILKYENQYKVGDCLYTYGEIQTENSTKLLKIPIIVTSIDANTIYVQKIQDYSQEVDSLESIPNLSGKVTFLVSSDKQIDQLRYSKNNLDLLQYTEFLNEQDVSSVTTRIGNLSELNLQTKNNQSSIPFNGYGMCTKNGIFSNAYYKSDYYLSDNDDSSRLASTEWVNKKLNNFDTNIDFTVYSDSINPEQYFSQSQIQDLYLNQDNNTTRTYLGYFGTLSIKKDTQNGSAFSAIVRASWKGTWSHRSINATYQNGKYTQTSTYIIKDQFNPGYYYSQSKNGNQPTSPIYLGTDQQGFQVDEINRYLWYTNDGEVWILVQEYIDPVQNVLYIRSTTRNYYSSEGKYYPAGFVCYSNSGQTIAIGNGRGVSNYIKVLNEYVEREPLTQLQNIQNIASSGEIPILDGYNWLWSLKNGEDPTLYSSWELVSGISSSIPVNAILDQLAFGNCGGITNAMVWTTVDDDNKNTGLVDTSVLTNGNGTSWNWKNPAFIKAFLVTAISQFLRRNQSRYTSALGWSFNYDATVHLRGWGGYINFYIGAPENPTSDDPNSMDSLPKSTFLWVSGSVICAGYKADFYFDRVFPGLRLNVGQCYQENTGIGNTANNVMFFDMEYSGLKVTVTELS